MRDLQALSFQRFNELGLRQRKCLVAFSGGPDSVFLLTMLAHYFKSELPDRIALAYVNYHDSPKVNEEEKTVFYYAKEYGLKLLKTDTQFHRDSKDHNFEDWARTFRYDFFAQCCQKEKLDGVLTAHQQTDSLETYQLQKQRRNLPRVYGLPLRTQLASLWLYRPLLDIAKEEIYSYLKESNLLYYEDLTNRDDHTLRNRIRKERLTSEEQQKLLSAMASDNEKLAGFYARLATLTYPVSFCDFDLLSADEKRRLLFSLLRKQTLAVPLKRQTGLGKEAYEFLKRRTPGSLCLDGTYVLYRRSYGFFIDKDHTQENYRMVIDKAGDYQNDFIQVSLKDPSLFRITGFPLVIRNYRPGDQLTSGLPTKDVLTFLKKQQVPSTLIPLYPVFEKDGAVFYVPFYQDLRKKKIPLSIRSLY
ncbi:MAG: tRNA lysidine(34) synthetase TilS [Bacilli bacterium]|jgi:tRNA(Ile)-lysidine synthetase-like protein|nr:tRNA lysidine(34) synthetase TilS [Bacilli bacterium]